MGGSENQDSSRNLPGPRRKNLNMKKLSFRPPSLYLHLHISISRDLQAQRRRYLVFLFLNSILWAEERNRGTKSRSSKRLSATCAPNSFSNSSVLVDLTPEAKRERERESAVLSPCRQKCELEQRTRCSNFQDFISH